MIKRVILSHLIATTLLFSACKAQDDNNGTSVIPTDSTQVESTTSEPLIFVQPDAKDQISEFIRRIFQDSRGDLWLGTNGDGVARYDGDTLVYFAPPQGFNGYAIRGILEDKQGNIWFGTENGLLKYDLSYSKARQKPSFRHYTYEEGLIHNDVWSMTLDDEGQIWVGTLMGVSFFDPKKMNFEKFPLPESVVDNTRGVTSPWIVHAITQDRKGQMWFTTNSGAYYYDGEKLNLISEADGLCNNMVDDILEDAAGNIWFATHHQGVCRWDGTSFTHFGPEYGITGMESWSLFEDGTGHIWFPAENDGVHRYNPEAEGNKDEMFTHFTKADGLASNAIQTIYEDSEGRIWLGGHLGLYRYDGKTIHNVKAEGPWR